MSKPTVIGNGRYVLNSVISRGGATEVWRANDTALGLDVAVKLISLGSQPNNVAVEEFVREATSISRASHPNVVEVFDAGVEGDWVYLVEELLSGPDLAQMINNQGPLGIREGLQIAAQVADALAAIHETGLIHCDIKPASIVMHNDVPKIIDFASFGANPFDKSHWLVGSLIYVSPEQLLSRGATPAGDMYSLGSTLFAMLTGHPPFLASGTEAFLARLRGTSMRLSDFRTDIPQDLDALVSRLLSRDPGERPSARIAAREFRRLLDDSNAKTGPLPPYDVFLSFPRDDRVLGAQLAAALERQGLSVFLDKNSPNRGPGHGPSGALGQELFDSAAFVALINPSTSSDRLQLSEIKYALSRGTLGNMLVIPIIASAMGLEELPRELARYQGISLDEATDLEVIAGRISEALQSRGTSGFDSQSAAEWAKLATWLDGLDDLLPDMHDVDLVEASLGLWLEASYKMAQDGLVAPAERQLRKGLHKSTTLLGPSHPTTLSFQANLGSVLLRAGDSREAAEHLRQIADTQSQALGPDHPATLNVLVLLSNAYAQLGQVDEALEIQRRTLEVMVRSLGPDHPSTLVARTNLARLAAARMDWPEAASLLRETLLSAQRVLGDDHPATLAIASELHSVTTMESGL